VYAGAEPARPLGERQDWRGGTAAQCAFSGSFRGLELVPTKWRCLVPGERRDCRPQGRRAQSRPPALIRVLRDG
jgi:hypothetical protein